MPIGIGAAMLIGTAVSGGGAIAAAKLQSNAAKNAQKAQQAGTDKALEIQQQQTAPYRALGEQSAARLGQLVQNQTPYTQVFGNGRGAQGQPGQPMQGPGSMGGPPAPPPMGLGALGQPQQAPGMGQAPGGGQAPPQAMQRHPMGQRPTQPGPPPMPMPQQQGAPVKMQGPDGQPRDVPAQFVQQAMASGFRRLG